MRKIEDMKERVEKLEEEERKESNGTQSRTGGTR